MGCIAGHEVSKERRKARRKKFYETPEFLRTQKKWYAKLKDEGFQDIEATKSTRGVTRSGDDSRTVLPQASVSEYYRLARAFLHDYTFKDNKHWHMWLLHSEGLSIRMIAEKLGSDRTTVHEVIVDYSKCMLAVYSPKRRPRVLSKWSFDQNDVLALGMIAPKHYQRLVELMDICQEATAVPAQPRRGITVQHAG